MRSRVALLVALLLLIVAGALLPWQGWVLHGEDALVVVLECEEDDPELLSYEVRVGAARAPEPGLTGRGDALHGTDAHGPVTVRVEGPGGCPLPGVMVVARRGDVPEIALLTSAVGVTRFPDLPYDGSVRLRFRLPRAAPARGYAQLRPWDGGAPGRQVRGPHVTYRAAVGWHVTLKTVEADTGRAVDDSSFTFAPHTYSRPRLSWNVEPPSGRLAWDPQRVERTVSPYAEELLVVYPLRREVDALVSVKEDDGSAAIAQLSGVRVVGRSLSPKRFEGDAYGRFRVHGIPHLRGEVVEVKAATARPGLEGSATASAIIPDDVRDALDVVVRLPPLRPASGAATGMGVGTGAKSGSFSGHRDSIALRSHRARAVVTVLRHDGRPAAYARVLIARSRALTDAGGCARLKRIMPGTHDVVVEHVGLLPMSTTATFENGKEVRIELREPQGATLEVEVVDDLRVPLPFASVEVKTPSCLPCLDLRGSVQRIDPFTDHRGRRTFEHVEVGRLRIRATWGSRSGEIIGVTAEGKKQVVRIVLSRPRDESDSAGR